MHSTEIHKIAIAVERKGMTLVPLEMYFNEKGRAKVKLGLAQGKNHSDKRQDAAKRDWNRQKSAPDEGERLISVPDTGNSSVNRPAFPVPDDDGAAKHLIAGTRLPDVALVATRGASVNLARYQERAVVFVYPMTGTPGVANPPDWDRIPGAHGSTPEAEGFRDTHAQFELLGYEVFGVSSQSPDDQRAFAARTGIPYLLLSNANFAFADALGLPRFETGGVSYPSNG